MHNLKLKPLAALIARDGRAFDLGGVARSLPWFYPATVAGALRSALGKQETHNLASLDELSKISVRGPLPRLLGGTQSILFPVPADLWTDVKNLSPNQLKPIESKEQNKVAMLFSHLINLFNKADGNEFDGASGEIARPKHWQDIRITSLVKPGKNPAWWTHDTMMKWLVDPRKLKNQSPAYQALPQVIRTHASIKPDTQTIHEVFRTSALDFFAPKWNEGENQSEQALGLAVQFEKPHTGIMTLGGERRPVWCAIDEQTHNNWSIGAELNPILKNKNTKYLRLILATPAIFTQGWLPGWIDKKTFEGTPPFNPNLKLQMFSAIVPRWQGISGWDMRQNRAKPTRRMVPAGAVYFFKILDGVWDVNQWLAPVSDGEQDRCDGFGLGLWGKYEK